MSYSLIKKGGEEMSVSNLEHDHDHDSHYCTNCETRTMPHLEYHHGLPARSICPGCGLIMREFKKREPFLPLAISVLIVLTLVGIVSLAV